MVVWSVRVNKVTLDARILSLVKPFSRQIKMTTTVNEYQTPQEFRALEFIELSAQMIIGKRRNNNKLHLIAFQNGRQHLQTRERIRVITHHDIDCAALTVELLSCFENMVVYVLDVVDGN